MDSRKISALIIIIGVAISVIIVATQLSPQSPAKEVCNKHDAQVEFVYMAEYHCKNNPNDVYHYKVCDTPMTVVCKDGVPVTVWEG